MQSLTSGEYMLPLNTTTAFLTPGFRTKNIILTADVALEGRPASMYKALLQLYDLIQGDQADPKMVLIETLRLLTAERDRRRDILRQSLEALKPACDQLPLAVEDIITLVQQHMQSKGASRLPVLVVAAAYAAVERKLGEKILHLYSHNAADTQTGATGDVEITLVGEDNVVTAYEMKNKPVLISDIDIALKKICSQSTIENYVFVTTQPIDREVAEYAATQYEITGGKEVYVLDCLDFLRYFLHIFYRSRMSFLDEYQALVLAEPESAVSYSLKEVFLSLRKAAEGV